MVGCAKELGLDGRCRMASWNELGGALLPAIASLCDGNFVIIAEVHEDRLRVAKQASQGLQEMSPRRVRVGLGRRAWCRSHVLSKCRSGRRACLGCIARVGTGFGQAGRPLHRAYTA